MAPEIQYENCGFLGKMFTYLGPNFLNGKIYPIPKLGFTSQLSLDFSGNWNLTFWRVKY